MAFWPWGAFERVGASSDRLIRVCVGWTQAEDSSSRHASKMQAHQESAAAAAKKAAVESQAELKKVCTIAISAWLLHNVSAKRYC